MSPEATTRAIEINEVRLSAPRDAVTALRDFYTTWGEIDPRADGLALTIGGTRIVFDAADGRPFHHFALQVPGDRFDAAQEWLAGRAPLRASPEDGALRFDFEGISGLASYVEDPAGNIVELIAFTDLDATGAAGPFHPRELLGVAEIGLVTSDPGAARAQLAAAGLDAWQGSTDPEDLQFTGARGHTVILACPGRGWLPDGRPAESWPAAVRLLVDGQVRTATLAGGRLQVA